MDPPLQPPLPTTICIPTANPATTIPMTAALNYPDSANSSPRSRHAETWDEPLPPVPGAKLRLMCSYGGHIIPRPHDKSLCYVGGDTRIVVVDRSSSLAELHSRLSHALLNGRSFLLKYQLPTEDLDSLISVTTDEDLENMIEEYDRTMASSPLKPARLRLFLFFTKPETVASMGALLDDAKSETWFVDALNGANLLPRGLSDSAAIDNFLEVDQIPNSDSCADLAAQNEALPENKQGIIKSVVPDVHSTLPDSPMMETSSSFESSVSSPSMSNLPPIKVRIEDSNGRFNDQMIGLDEQFSQISVASNAVKQLDHAFATLTANTLPIPSAAGGGTVPVSLAHAMNSGAVMVGENMSRVISDDEKSDHGAPTALRKPPLPLQPVQRKICDTYNLPSPDSKHTGVYNLPSPDSVASDSSIASATSLSRQTIYQDATPTTNSDARPPIAAGEFKSNIPDQISQMQMQLVQDPMIVPPQQSQLQHPQFIHTGTHYIQHPASGAVPISSYYPVYAPQSHQPLHFDQQHQMYLLPVAQNQPYNLTTQSNIADAAAAASCRTPAPPIPTIAPSSAAYKETLSPVYPTKTTPSPKPDMATNVYRTAAAASPTLFQVPHFQQQYYGVSQAPAPSQSLASASAAMPNYGFDYVHSVNDQLYYAQHPVTPIPTQYQTMTPNAAVIISQASAQMTTDTGTQQMANSQPL